MKGSGRQISFLKAVDGCVEALLECGINRDEAELRAHKHMRPKLSAKQLADLEASEQPVEKPLVLPALVPDPQVAEPEPPPADDEPHVRILQRRRGDHDELVWVEVDNVATRMDPAAALSFWLNDQWPEPLSGQYRAEGNGGSAEDYWAAEAA